MSEFLIVVTRPFQRKIQLRWTIELLKPAEMSDMSGLAWDLYCELRRLPGVEGAELRRYSAWLDIADWVTDTEKMAEELRRVFMYSRPPLLHKRLEELLNLPYTTCVTTAN